MTMNPFSPDYEPPPGNLTLFRALFPRRFPNALPLAVGRGLAEHTRVWRIGQRYAVSDDALSQLVDLLQERTGHRPKEKPTPRHTVAIIRKV